LISHSRNGSLLFEFLNKRKKRQQCLEAGILLFKFLNKRLIRNIIPKILGSSTINAARCTDIFHTGNRRIHTLGILFLHSESRISSLYASIISRLSTSTQYYKRKKALLCALLFYRCISIYDNVLLFDMTKLVEMDEKVKFSTQMEEKVGPIVFKLMKVKP
jgi:hypothetical protein